MVVWVGGLIFFAFVEAPTAFRVMGTTRQFAQIIGDSVSELDRMGQVCGFIFLIATAMVWLRAWRRRRWILVTQIVLVVLMIGATMVVQAGILPAMERDRIAAGETSPRRLPPIPRGWTSSGCTRCRRRSKAPLSSSALG